MFSNQRCSARLQGTLLSQANVTANSADDQVLLHRFEFIGPPGIPFFDCNGGEQFVASIARVDALA